MILIIPVEMKKDEELLRSLEKIREEKEILVLLDESIIRIVTEITLRKGWLGFAAARDVTKVLYEEYKTMAKKWAHFANEKLKNSKVKFMEGNFKENLAKEVNKKKPSRIYIIKGKEFNPYWPVVKPIIESMDYPITIL